MNAVAAVEGGGGIPAAAFNTPFSFVLDAGENAQISQDDELTGSVIMADKPIGLMAGHDCMNVPGTATYCDHGEQMIPPIQALGRRYVGVMYRPRSDEPAIWRIVGVVDGTNLSWAVDVGGPAVVNQGEVHEFVAENPFVVESQDDDHPFLMAVYMSGSNWDQLTVNDGTGDPDFVYLVPTEQYRTWYSFFTDPTFPETNLVVVRAMVDGEYADVELDCVGTLTGWAPLWQHEWTRVDLTTGDFESVGSCTAGRHDMSSDKPFAVWVWGWGSPATTIFTNNVSYGFPAGMSVGAINSVVVDP
jgi:hypothetical protein